MIERTAERFSSITIRPGGLYRDPTVAATTAACDWRIADLVDAVRPVSLYLVIPPSDISRTKPLVRLVLNQIGRRLTERLEGDPTKSRRHRLLMMLDEFPAPTEIPKGFRLFKDLRPLSQPAEGQAVESAGTGPFGLLRDRAGLHGRLRYPRLPDRPEPEPDLQGPRSDPARPGAGPVVAAQIFKQRPSEGRAWGENNAILDNCHVRIAFASNDERTAKRISDALGTATELRAQRNYAGHRLAPWLSHVMVSRQETARPLLTPGEVMQLPPQDELVLVSGLAPIRATKLRYFEDANFTARVADAPTLADGAYADAPESRPDDWSGQVRSPDARLGTPDEIRAALEPDSDDDGGGLQRHPGLAEETAPAPPLPDQADLFGTADEDSDPAADKRALDRLTPSVRAHGVNEGRPRGEDLLPGF